LVGWRSGAAPEERRGKLFEAGGSGLAETRFSQAKQFTSYLDCDVMVTAYQYQPLKPGAIRVLILEPAADLDAPIRCKLEHVKCEDGVKPDPGYDALSYVWGPPADGSGLSIECDGGEIEVQFSCDSALRHLRRAHVPIRLWVDAVCINQKSLAEKEVQVGRMSQVYTLAARVFIFLGAGVGDVADLFAWMRKAGPLIRSHEGEASQQLAREARDRFGGFAVDCRPPLLYCR